LGLNSTYDNEFGEEKVDAKDLIYKEKTHNIPTFVEEESGSVE
jgi:hypothetical protein